MSNSPELSALIKRLEFSVQKKSNFLKTIRSPPLLIEGLKELNNVIGNKDVKDSVALQVSHLIMIKVRATENKSIKEEDVMLNTILYGPPGVGKTLIGTKLAKIWYSLGYMRPASPKNTNSDSDLKNAIREILKDNNTSTDDNAAVIGFMLMFTTILIIFLSMAWGFYNRFGGLWTIISILLLFILIFIVGYYVYSINNPSSSQSDTKISSNESESDTSPIVISSDDQIIKVVSRDDFIDQYVGWTSKKTNKLLRQNLGKVLFVDEAYSLINGPHDEFGMEALTTINLFLSQHPKDIIVIFAGYKDLLETGAFAAQKGLKRRFMWQFNCSGYNSKELFDIFNFQLKAKGWEISNPDEVSALFNDNYDAFKSFAGDTDRLCFFSKLEHSRDYIGNNDHLKLNSLETSHIKSGILKLRENSMHEDFETTNNPMANLMRMMSSSQEPKYSYR